MVEAGGVEPPSRDARIGPSTCIVPDSVSSSRGPGDGAREDQPDKNLAEAGPGSPIQPVRSVTRIRTREQGPELVAGLLGSHCVVRIGT